MIWPQSMFAILVGANEQQTSDSLSRATELGLRELRLDFGGVVNRDDLVRRLASVLQFPDGAHGLDAALDWMSDLSWLGDAAGHLLVVDNLDTLTDGTQADFLEMVPAVVDRWRSQGLPFVVVLTGKVDRGPVLSVLASANGRLQRYGELPWAQPGTGPVDVIDCG